ncbi:hypothetical protein [Arthrobacter sp. UYCu712]|uniref:hypothetical protein n=1 Tax=Arthrobacter sp. UYCu712 TaxID=3156340 RepID=UPI00339A5E52
MAESSEVYELSVVCAAESAAESVVGSVAEEPPDAAPRTGAGAGGLRRGRPVARKR